MKKRSSWLFSLYYKGPVNPIFGTSKKQYLYQNLNSDYGVKTHQAYLFFRP